MEKRVMQWQWQSSSQINGIELSGNCGQSVCALLTLTIHSDGARSIGDLTISISFPTERRHAQG